MMVRVASSFSSPVFSSNFVGADPTKISGRCGRLKCCLRYEYDTYEEYRRELPNVGAVIVTRLGQGKVVGQEILARKLLVRTLLDQVGGETR